MLCACQMATGHLQTDGSHLSSPGPGVRLDTRGSYRSRYKSFPGQGLHVALSRARAFPVPFFERCRTGSTSSSRLKDSVCWRFISAVSERTCPIKEKGRNRSMSLEGPLLATALITRKPLCILLYGVPSGQLARARKRLPAGNQGRRVAALRCSGRRQHAVANCWNWQSKEPAARRRRLRMWPEGNRLPLPDDGFCATHCTCCRRNRLAWRQRDGVRPNVRVRSASVSRRSLSSVVATGRQCGRRIL